MGVNLGVNLGVSGWRRGNKAPVGFCHIPGRWQLSPGTFFIVSCQSMKKQGRAFLSRPCCNGDFSRSIIFAKWVKL